MAKTLTTLTLLLLSSLVATIVHAELLTVQTVRVTERDTYDVARVYAGELTSRRESRLGFEFPGAIATVNVDEGDLVATGDLLARLDTSAVEAQVQGAAADVASARANLRAQKSQLALSISTLRRQEDLAKTGHASVQRLDELRMQQQVDQSRLLVLQTQLQAAEARLRLNEANLAKSEIRAPYGGILQARHVDEGSIVSPGQTVLEIVEHGRMEARIGIPADLADRVSPDRTYEFKVNQQAVPGRLKTILPRVDAATGTVTAVFTLDHDRLFAGSLVEMNLTVSVRERGFWVPLNSLAESQRGLWSVLVVEDSLVASRLVEILYRGSDQVYVRGTLREGDEVIATGTGRVVPGQAVNIATRGGTGR